MSSNANSKDQKSRIHSELFLFFSFYSRLNESAINLKIGKFTYFRINSKIFANIKSKEQFYLELFNKDYFVSISNQID